LSISSSTDCDQQNLLQLLSDVEDGPEHLMNADDYLNINKITTPSDSSYPVMPALRVSTLYLPMSTLGLQLRLGLG
jgi:hypothetical protein